MKPSILASQRIPGSRAARTGLQRAWPQQQLRTLMLCLGLVLAMGGALAAMGDPSPNDPAWLGAETHYKRALEIDPKHRHALEYYGELFLMKGDLAGAETMLARLNKACFFGCEELRDLKAAIARHKARAVTGK